MRANVFADKIYLESGSWKCDKSPTGAHYFIGDSNVIQCKYCGQTKDGLPKQEDLLQKGRLRGTALRQKKARGNVKSHRKLYTF